MKLDGILFKYKSINIFSLKPRIEKSEFLKIPLFLDILRKSIGI